MPCDRYFPNVAFPAYAFVPGKHPHPVTDSRGHRFGQHNKPSVPLDPLKPSESPDLLVAIDLFNAGYYWEAHEVWEGLWVAANRTGELAEFLKGLIKLAAAGVKMREGQIVGVERHARRALELFESVHAIHPDTEKTYCGLNWEDLIRHTSDLVKQPIIDDSPSIGGRAVIPFRLTLSDLDPLSGQAYTTHT